MSLIDKWVYKKVCELYRDTQGPVRTLLVADLVGKHDRSIRYSLTRLEQAGHVVRRGQRGGWLPAGRAAFLAETPSLTMAA